MDVFLIEHKVRDDINAIIKESLTVNDEVLQSSDKISKYIIDGIKSQPSKIFANGGGEREISFQSKVFNDELKVFFNIRNFNFINMKYYREYIKKYSIDTLCTSVYKEAGKMKFALCNINYVSVGFEPFPKFYEDIHHELNHLLQQYKEGHTYKKSKEYAKIATDIYSDDEIRHNTAMLLYLCTSTEQDSFVGSVYNFVRYNYIIKIPNGTVDFYIKETDAYKNICKLQSLYDIITNNKEQYNDIILKIHGFNNWNNFDKFVNRCLNRFKTKFAMVVKKCKRDFVLYEQNTWCEMGSPKIEYLKLI